MIDFEDFDLGDFFGDNISIVSEEINLKDIEKNTDSEIQQTIFPILPVRNMVMFPNVIVPITAGRNNSKHLIEDAKAEGKLIGIVSQKNANVETPSIADLYAVGTIAKIIKVLKLPDGNTTAIMQGITRFKIENLTNTSPYFQAEAKILSDIKSKNKKEFDAILSNIKDLAKSIIRLENPLANIGNITISNMNNAQDTMAFVGTNINFDIEQKQRLLEEKNLHKRAEKLNEILSETKLKLELKNQIQQKTSKELDKNQREYFLNQQIRTIQEELGGGTENDIEELLEKAKQIPWKDEVEEHFQKEIKRLQRHNPSSPDYNVQRNYLDFFTDLPWDTYTKDIFDINKAQKTLDKAHFGLEDIKKRVLEHMAVLKLKNDMKSPILLLVGPPGVGKTSLGKSIADALGRKYVRVSLGGLHDESEIRGHRKTYIGAMAGRILQSIKKAEVSNPVIVLDEIDKIGQGIHGDPSSALLEVLDPEQNNSFYDNYLELGYDLSKVLFIATANSLSTIQTPLLDRMEIIEVSGYTLEEKIEIAKRHLIKKQQEANGLSATSFKLGITELKHIIEAHTAESGVRTLEKRISAIARWVALQIATEKEYSQKINIQKIDEILGIPRPKDQSEETSVPGVVTGLAWTSVGGDILFIESIISNGKGNLTMTGNLGNVMKESATIALEYIKAKYKDFGIPDDFIDNKNIHIHVPEGATPKDGPSAGIAMLTSMVSSFTNKKVKSHLAMTGEITLRGKVLPVGGIKEKLLAATRAGVKQVILCEANRKDVEEINKDYLKNLKIHYVTHMEEVIKLAIME
jgi:endopeptidase La